MYARTRAHTCTRGLLKLWRQIRYAGPAAKDRLRQHTQARMHTHDVRNKPAKTRAASMHTHTHTHTKTIMIHGPVRCWSGVAVEHPLTHIPHLVHHVTR